MADTLSFPLPVVESGQKYAAASLAQEITNLRLTSEGTLESVRGPVPLIPDYGSGYPYGSGRMYGVYHALLDDGTRDVTLFRCGDTLFQQTGWTRGVETLQTGLSSDPNARWPDQFVEVAGKIVWNNAVDTALVYDGYVLLPLGYDRAPGAPQTAGPGDTGHPVFRNAGGYSHPGRVGTVGNFFSNGQGSLLPYARAYYVQYEDYFGNRSALSPASGAVTLRQEYTATEHWNAYTNYPNGATQDLGLLSVNTSDLTRQFLVEGIPSGPAGTVARLLYATPDLNQSDGKPRLLARIPDNLTNVYPDNTPDGGLGAEAEDYITLPRFTAMCAHNGCLVVLEGRNVRISEPGFIGTFKRKSFAPLDADGAEPSGVFSFGGKLYAATTRTLFVVEETEYGWQARAISHGTGLVGPNAVDATPFGVCVGLDASGFWSLDFEGKITPISEEIYPLFKRLRSGYLSHVCVRWSPLDRELLCAIPKVGPTFGNNLVMVWDGRGWRRRDYGIAFESLCITKDWRQDVYGAGQIVGGVYNVFCLTGEAQTFTPPTRVSRFRSQWLRMDPTGRQRFNVRKIHIGIVESTSNDLTVTVWQNGTRDTAVVTTTREGRNPATSDLWNTLVLGTGAARTPRLTWKEVAVRVRSAESFSFDVSATYPVPLHIAAFAFDGELAGGDARESEQ